MEEETTIAYYEEDNDGDDEDGRPIIRKFHYCGKCGKSLYSYSSRCPRCNTKFREWE